MILALIPLLDRADKDLASFHVLLPSLARWLLVLIPVTSWLQGGCHSSRHHILIEDRKRGRGAVVKRLLQLSWAELNQTNVVAVEMER